MAKIKDLTGQTFNRLTVIGQAGMKRRHVLWECRCICGNTCTAMGYQLKSGEVKSCGCLQAENRRIGYENNRDNKPVALNGKLNSNNKSGIKGVFWNTQKSKWEARIKVDGKSYHLLLSDNKSDCAKARADAEDALRNHKFYDYIEDKKKG